MRAPAEGRVQGRFQQLGDLAGAHHHGASDPGQRPAPDPRRAVAALRGAPRSPRARRDRGRRAFPAGHLHRPQRPRGLRTDDLRHRPGGPLRLRNQPRRPRTSTATRTAGNRWRSETQQIEVAGGEPVEVELRFTRHGPVLYRDPEKNLAYRAAGRVARAGDGAVPGERGVHARPRLGRLSRGDEPLGGALGEPGLRRRRRQHRLEARRAHARASELGRTVACPWRRPVRVGGLSSLRISCPSSSTRRAGGSPPPTR